MREKRRLKLFEHRVLRRIFGPKRDEVKGEWRKLHDEELYDRCPSINIVRIIKSRLGGACSTCGESRGIHRVLAGKTEG